MKILILNWRSIKDPLEGGAERATYEFAKRWINTNNAEVFWISPPYNNNIKSETIDGINFDYVGVPLTRNVIQLLWAFPFFYISCAIRYLTKYKNKIDVVIDQAHGIPYLTPLYVKEKKVVYIHEVAGTIWNIMYPLPIKLLGHLSEKIIFPIYNHYKIKFIANSPSTYNDLINVFKLDKNNIKIIPYGVTAPLIDKPQTKAQDLTIIYINRLVKMKGIERCLVIFSKILQKQPSAKLLVLGRGEDAYVQELKSQANKLGITHKVEFLGHIDGQEKFDLLAKSHVLINASYLEGWGLVNIEANRMGTPVVAFKVKGCVDSVQDGISGYLSVDNDLEDMTNNILRIHNNIQLQQSSIDYAKQFDWDLQAHVFYEYLTTI